MYTFYTDKQELFECKLNLEGANLSDSRARLVLESGNYNLLFYGNIDESGKCQIPVARLKSLLGESDTGKVKLEVIAEDTYFEPWSDSYNVKTSKKVTVEVTDKNKPLQTSSKKVTVSEVKSEPKTQLPNYTNQFLKVLDKKKITLANLKEHTKTLQTLGNIFTKKYNLTEGQRKVIVESVIKKLKG